MGKTLPQKFPTPSLDHARLPPYGENQDSYGVEVRLKFDINPDCVYILSELLIN